jgi:uncharacterized protein (TIRG00374 family)
MMTGNQMSAQRIGLNTLLKSRRFWIGIVISLALLFPFFYGVDFGELGRAFVRANYVFIIPAVIMLMIIMGLKTVRWQLLMKHIRGIALTRIYPVEVIGHMANAVLPLRLGELVRAYLLGEKEKVSKIAVLATVVAARTLDGISLIFFVLVLSFFLPMAEWLRPVIYIASGLFLFVIILLIVVVSSPSRTQMIITILLKPLSSGWRTKLNDWLKLFITGLECLRNPGRLTVAFLLSLIIWVAEGINYYIIGLAFELGQPLYVFLMAAAAANLALLIPSLPGGIGNFEYFCSRSIAFFGVATAVANAYAIVLHISLLIPLILLGLIFMWVENLSLAQIARSRSVADYPETVG